MPFILKGVLIYCSYFFENDNEINYTDIVWFINQISNLFFIIKLWFYYFTSGLMVLMETLPQK